MCMAVEIRQDGPHLHNLSADMNSSGTTVDADRGLFRGAKHAVPEPVEYGGLADTGLSQEDDFEPGPGRVQGHFYTEGPPRLAY